MGDHFRPSLAAKSAVITDASLFSMPVSKHPADQLHRPHSLSLLSFSQDDIPTGKAIRPQNEAQTTRKLCGVRKWNQIYVKSTYLHAKAEGKRQINIQSYWIQWNFLRRYFMWIKESTLTHKDHNGPKKSRLQWRLQTSTKHTIAADQRANILLLYPLPSDPYYLYTGFSLWRSLLDDPNNNLDWIPYRLWEHFKY